MDKAEIVPMSKYSLKTILALGSFAVFIFSGCAQNTQNTQVLPSESNLKTFEIKTLKLSFQYPAEWGEAKLDTLSPPGSERNQISFKTSSFEDDIFFVYNKKGLVLMGDPLDEEFAPDQPVSCDELKKDPKRPFENMDQCQSFTVQNHIFMIFHFSDTSDVEEHYSGIYYTGNSEYPFIVGFMHPVEGLEPEIVHQIFSSIKQI